MIAIPTIKSKRGPAKHPVIAIDPNPHFEIAMHANKSPYEFPSASTVMPKKLLLIPKISPKRVRRSMMNPAANHIHTILMTKDQQIKIVMKEGAYEA